MQRGVHGEKIIAALDSAKLPYDDKDRLRAALQKYDEWIGTLEKTDAPSVEELIDKLVDLLNEYKLYIDINLIFDSPEDFLYRQRGQLKLDNTVIEEFLPVLVRKCIVKEFGKCDMEIGSQIATFSSAYFESNVKSHKTGGGLCIKTKTQDFSISRTLYLRASYTPTFDEEKTVTVATHLGYVIAELKTNLDKTMFQEASATAHDLKLAVPRAKYYLICDFLDMTPISTATTDIDEVLIVRKASRINANIRRHFSSYAGRQSHRNWYMDYLKNNPYSADVFKRFIEHIFSQIKDEDLIEKRVLDLGYF